MKLPTNLILYHPQKAKAMKIPDDLLCVICDDETLEWIESGATVIGDKTVLWDSWICPECRMVYTDEPMEED